MEHYIAPQAFWLTNNEVKIAEQKMGGNFIGFGYLRDENGMPLGKLPVDLFITNDPDRPCCIGVYREKDGQTYAHDAGNALFPEIPGMLTAKYKR